MTKWEYKVVRTTRDEVPQTPEEFVAELNRLGEDGWEIAAALGESLLSGAVFLKRPRECRVTLFGRTFHIKLPIYKGVLRTAATTPMR